MLPSLPLILLYNKPFSPDPKIAVSECIEEVEAICNQIRLVDRQFGDVVLLGDLREMAFMCQFHFENYIVRVYGIRERLWQILTRLSGVPKGNSSAKKFKENVQAHLAVKFPNLGDEYSKFIAYIDSEIEMRNYITHEGFVRPAILLGPIVDNFDNFKTLAEYVNSDPQEVDRWKPASPEDVRGAIEDFVIGEKKHIRRIIKDTESFLASCKAASEQKVW